MTRPPATPRRAVAVFALVALACLLPAAQVFGQSETEETATTAIVSQEGWWNRAQGPQSGEPTNPLRPAIGPVVPAPSTVPSTGLGVGALLGDPDKVAAIGIVLEAPLEPTVERLVLSLRERPNDNGANANVDNAKIAACPINSFWGGTKNGDWVNRPTCDEGQSVAGKRLPDGTWTFDLGLMANQWLSTTEPMDQNGVLLVESVDAPQSFQISFGDMSTNTIKLDFAATGLNFSGSSDFTFDDDAFTDESFDTDTTFEEPFDAGTTDGDGAGFESDESVFTGTGLIPDDVSNVPTEPTDTTTSGDAIPAGASRPVKLLGNLPLPAVLFLILLLVGTALFLGLVLGPMAEPSPTRRRAGGVSRALAEREAAGRP